MIQAVLLVQGIPVTQHPLSVPDPHRLQVAPKLFRAGVKFPFCCCCNLQFGLSNQIFQVSHSFLGSQLHLPVQARPALHLDPD